MEKLCGNCRHCSDTGTYCHVKDKEVDWDSHCKTWQKDNGDKYGFVRQAIAGREAKIELREGGEMLRDGDQKLCKMDWEKQVSRSVSIATEEYICGVCGDPIHKGDWHAREDLTDYKNNEQETMFICQNCDPELVCKNRIERGGRE